MSRSAKAPIVAIFALASLAAFVGQCSAGIYSFDNKHANVNFTYYVGFASQSGRFTDMNGVFQFDRRAPAQGSIKAVIKTASLTANAFKSELRGSRFFNVGVFPEIRFASRSVKPVGEDRAEFNGDLTMNGVTRPVTLQVVFQPEARAGSGKRSSSIVAGQPRPHDCYDSSETKRVQYDVSNLPRERRDRHRDLGRAAGKEIGVASVCPSVRVQRRAPERGATRERPESQPVTCPPLRTLFSLFHIYFSDRLPGARSQLRSIFARRI